MAFQQHTVHLTENYDLLMVEYTELKANHEQLRQMVLSMASQSGGRFAPPPFWSYNN
jgi:deoxyxylulose-5-phosphate synthase